MAISRAIRITDDKEWLEGYLIEMLSLLLL